MEIEVEILCGFCSFAQVSITRNFSAFNLCELHPLSGLPWRQSHVPVAEKSSLAKVSPGINYNRLNDNYNENQLATHLKILDNTHYRWSRPRGRVLAGGVRRGVKNVRCPPKACGIFGFM